MKDDVRYILEWLYAAFLGFAVLNAFWASADGVEHHWFRMGVDVAAVGFLAYSAAGTKRRMRKYEVPA